MPATLELGTDSSFNDSDSNPSHNSEETQDSINSGDAEAPPESTSAATNTERPQSPGNVSATDTAKPGSPTTPFSQASKSPAGSNANNSSMRPSGIGGSNPAGGPAGSTGGGGGAMAQLGLVPPGAAMSIIRNQQSSPSAQQTNHSEDSVVASPRSGMGADSTGQASVGGAGGQPHANANTAESAIDGAGAGSTGTQSSANVPSMNAAGGNANAAGNMNGAGGSGSNVAAGSNITSINNTNNSSSSSNAHNLPPGLVYPALHLHPLNDTFAPKQISLAPPGPHNRIRIGRQTNAKTVPHPNNGYFDSKVLSRAHAEVWSQDGKVYIKDIKSSNGTFINGDRLSPEAQESEVYELHSEDLVEFGIDIVGDDNKTIIHHKVACRVYLVITAEDALGMRNDFNSLYHGGHRAPLGHSGIGPGAEGGLRRGKHPGGMSFDHILSKLQNELAKSRETNNELGGLATTFSDIHETLGGGLPPASNPPYQHMVPTIMSESDAAASKEAADDAKKQSATVAALQSSLVETQASLAVHVDRIRSLEGMLAEHEQIKSEVGLLKYQMEVAKQEVDAMVHSRQSTSASSRSMRAAGNEEDFDDGASIASADTVTADDPRASVPHVPKGVDEVEQATIEAKSLPDSGSEDDDHVGPRAPPDLPSHLMAKGHQIVDAPSFEALTSQFEAKNQALLHRLEALESQLEGTLSLGRDLQSQHSSAADTVKFLQDKVASLEAEVQAKVKQIEGSAAAMTAMEGRWVQWREQIEEGWRQEREGWEEEREHIRSVVAAWDEANRKLEEEVANASSSNTPRSGPGSSQGGGKRRGSKNAKRRQGKRHVNRDLRALLYKSEFNREVTLSSGDEGEDDDDVDHKSTSTTDQSTSSGSSGGKASTTATSPPLTASNASSGSEDGSRKGAHLSAGRKLKEVVAAKTGALDGDPANLPFRFKDQPATLPMLTAIGVVIVGAAAWALAKKEKS